MLRGMDVSWVNSQSRLRIEGIRPRRTMLDKASSHGLLLIPRVECQIAVLGMAGEEFSKAQNKLVE